MHPNTTQLQTRVHRSPNVSVVRHYAAWQLPAIALQSADPILPSTSSLSPPVI